MSLEEVLQLEKTNVSIKKIDMFLAMLDKSTLEYAKVTSFKATIYLSLSKPQEALNVLIEALKETIVDEGIIILCDALISLALEAKNHELAIKYINQKRKHLNALNSSLNTFDMMNYFHSLGNKLEVKRNAMLLLQDDIKEDMKMAVYALLSSYAFSEHDYNRYLDYASRLEEYYRLRFDFDKANELTLYRSLIWLESKEYDLVIEGIRAVIDDSKNPIDLKVRLAALLIRTYILKGDLKRASICESEYAFCIEEASNEASLEFAKAALELYGGLNSNYSISLYQHKVTELQSLIKGTRQDKPLVGVLAQVQPSTKEKLTSEPKSLKEDLKAKIKYKKGDFKSIEISEIYQRFGDTLKNINQIQPQLFREAFRRIGILICKELPIKEIVVLYHKQDYQGFHYKKERVYDKRFEEDLSKTISYNSLSDGEEIYVDVLGNSEFNINIVTNSPYSSEITKAYSFPLVGSKGTYAAITYFSDIRFVDADLAYEKLMMANNIINNWLNSYLYIVDFEEENKKLQLLFDSIGVKEEVDGFVTLNKEAALIFEAEEKMDYATFAMKIENKDLIAYNKAHEQLISLRVKQQELRYHINTPNKRKYILERMTMQYENGNVSIYSSLQDITAYEAKEESLTKLAYTNPLTKRFTKLKLIEDFKTLITEKKFSLILLNVNNFKMYNDIYGYSFGNELVYAIGKMLNEEVSKENNGLCYHLDSDKFAIVFSSNDKRFALNHINELMSKLSLRLKDLNKRLNITFSCGVFRYTKNITEGNLEKILLYTSDALLEAHEISSNGNKAVMFDHNNYKKRYFEAQLVTHISECIDNNTMAINYSQIVDISKSSVVYYYSRLNLINYDVNLADFRKVIESKGLNELLDKYLIMHSLRELKVFYDKTHYYLKLMIPINASVFATEDFTSFLFAQIKFFKLPTNVIILDIIGQDSKVADNIKKIRQANIVIAARQVDDMLVNNCQIYLHDMQKYKEAKLENFIDLCASNGIELVGINVNQKETIELCAKHELNLIMGECFKKKFKIKDIIDLV